MENIDFNIIDTIIIAGMGGLNICDIINNCSNAKNLSLTYIFQPMTHIELLRKFLYNNGFSVLKEKAAFYNNKYYTIMYVKYTGVYTQIDEIFEYIGKISQTDGEYQKDYILNIISKLEKKVNGLSLSENKNYENLEYKKICIIINTIKDIYDKMENKSKNKY
jgi:tRNA (adenine22-N1)-methyltransferase